MNKKSRYNPNNPGACIFIHGMSKSPEHATWRRIIQRCTNPNVERYPRYGGRGITICDRWLEPEGKGFINFIEDMGNRPSKEHSIERADNNGNYEPGNCKWATRKEQCRNRTTSHYIEYNGQVKTIAEWSEITEVKQLTLLARIRKGWSIEKALTTKTNQIKANQYGTNDTKSRAENRNSDND